MTDYDGNLLEGLTSNIAVIVQDDNGKERLITPRSDNVLEGTVISAIIDEICPRLGIPAESGVLNVSDWRSWKAAFLTSLFTFNRSCNSVK